MCCHNQVLTTSAVFMSRGQIGFSLHKDKKGAILNAASHSVLDNTA